MLQLLLSSFRYCFWESKNRKFRVVRRQSARRRIAWPRETGSVIRYPRLYLYVVQTLLVTHNVVILWLFGAPHERECVNFSRAAPTGYSSAKVVPLAFLSTRHRHAISRIFLNSSRAVRRLAPPWNTAKYWRPKSHSKRLWESSCKGYFPICFFLFLLLGFIWKEQ